jgi:hypothetical protein
MSAMKIGVLLCLLLFCPVQAAAQKDFNVQFELLRYGIGVSHNTIGSIKRTEYWGNVRVGDLTFSYKRFRLGVMLLDNTPPGNSILPIEADFTIYQRPRKYLWFQGMVPDVLAEVGYYWANGIIDDDMFGPTWKLGFRGELDYYGVGAGAEIAYFSTSDVNTSLVTESGPAASVYVRLLATNFGF